MKTGDKELIAFKSVPALEILLDRADSNPDSDTAHPQFAAELETVDELIYRRLN